MSEKSFPGGIEAQVHLWPWSVVSRAETVDLDDSEIHFPFYGSPLISLAGNSKIILPTRHEQFLPLGPAYEPQGNRLYETPHGVLSGNLQSIRVLSKTSTAVIQLHVDGATDRYLDIQEDGKPRESPLASIVLRWAQFFDGIIEEGPVKNGRPNLVPWENVLDYIYALAEEKHQPRRALIVKIAEEMHRRIPVAVNGARKILLRERRLLPINRLEETDSACLRWYIRQPGFSPAEKAGNRQELMGVARRETHNIHENRVLKDFLGRSSREAKRYINAEVGDDPALRSSSRARTVLSYGALCSFLRRNPIFEMVSRPSPGTPPNYVLLNDARYREVWRWYRKLLRHEEDEDRFWDWQARTWADIVRLLVNASLIYHLKTAAPESVQDGIVFEPILKASLHVRREQLLGMRIRSGSEPGPLLVRRVSGGVTEGMSVLEVVHPDEAKDHLVAAQLGVSGAHLYLSLQPLNPASAPRLMILVWAVHTAGTSRHPPWSEIATSAGRALTAHEAVLAVSRIRIQPRLAGLVVCSELEAKTAVTHETSSSSRLALTRIPAKPEGWLSGIEEMAIALEGLLRELM